MGQASRNPTRVIAQLLEEAKPLLDRRETVTTCAAGADVLIHIDRHILLPFGAEGHRRGLGLLGFLGLLLSRSR
jgi:hypothetical protein